MAVAGAAAEPTLPRLDDARHLGVASCAGSTCHGAATPREASSVLQNEFFTWHRRDRHARAYELLLQEPAQQIARRLGVGAAEQAGVCLDCHADNVPPEQRGPRFRLSDGVGCEACHGGAGEWIRTHSDAGTTHADNLANGLYPTERPAARARLCMSCHFGRADARMTHRLMIAGHPPLAFDLDVFGHIQPPHHRVDADYRRRKAVDPAAEGWALGQAAAARVRVDTLGAALEGGDGLFPELYFFECSSCHHELGAGRAGGSTAGLPPGSLRLEDGPLRVFGHLVAGLDPALGRSWSQALAALHVATGESGAAVRSAAERLVALTAQVRERIEAGSVDAEGARGMIRRIVEAGVRSGFEDRTWAEHSTMVLASLVALGAERGWFSSERQRELDAALDRLYGSFGESGRYSPGDYRQGLRRFAAALGQA